MKRLERCRINGEPQGAGEIPLLYRFFTYSVKRSRVARTLVSRCPEAQCGRSSSVARDPLETKTVSGGEFDWGGTSVKITKVS